MGSWPRRRGPPTRPSSRVVGSAESCSYGAQACSMHVTDCMHVTPFLNMCMKSQEGTRSGAGALSLLLSFPDARRRARALSLFSFPRALCARSDQIVETVDQILAAIPLTLCPPKTKSQVNVTSV